jgi:hypothetical protein
LNSLKFVEHGLVLIGSVDGHDGMNVLGKYNKSESMSLDFFLMKCSCSLRRLPVRGVTYLSSNVGRGRWLNCARISSRMAGMEGSTTAPASKLLAHSLL